MKSFQCFLVGCGLLLLTVATAPAQTLPPQSIEWQELSTTQEITESTHILPLYNIGQSIGLRMWGWKKVEIGFTPYFFDNLQILQSNTREDYDLFGFNGRRSVPKNRESFFVTQKNRWWVGRDDQCKMLQPGQDGWNPGGSGMNRIPLGVCGFGQLISTLDSGKTWQTAQDSFGTVQQKMDWNIYQIGRAHV